MIRDNPLCRLQWNTHETSVDHALGFSASRTRLQWSFSGARTSFSGPWPRPTFSENPGRISSSPQNPGNHRQHNTPKRTVKASQLVY